jgi:thiol-disulfide isomerase/thioredoxin
VAFLARDEQPGAPPLGGTMRNFTVAGAPSPAPRTDLVARDGTKTSLAAHAGKLVVANFWATWCGPCIREMPSLVRLQEKLAGTDAIVLALSEDLNGWPMIAPFVREHRLEGLTILHDAEAATGRALKVSALPTTVLFDPDGRELGRLTGPAEWDAPEALALIRYYLGPAR